MEITSCTPLNKALCMRVSFLLVTLTILFLFLADEEAEGSGASSRTTLKVNARFTFRNLPNANTSQLEESMFNETISKVVLAEKSPTVTVPENFTEHNESISQVVVSAATPPSVPMLENGTEQSMVDDGKISLRPTGLLRGKTSMVEKEVCQTVSPSNSSGIPCWSDFPRSQFTDHVLDLVENLNLEGIKSCDESYDIVVSTPYSIPNVVCSPEVRGDHVWCETLTRILSDKILPWNVSVGFVMNDFFQPDSPGAQTHHACIGSSSPGGKFCMPNMEDVQWMNYKAWAREKQKKSFRIEYKTDVPWEERNSTPIFRGKAWLPGVREKQLCDSPNLTYDAVLREFPRRFRAVDYSVDHPDLLDARFAEFDWLLDPCMERNATNGLHKLLPADRIPPDDYFSQHQVAVVMGGIGAAFRLGLHLMTGTAVVLQEFLGKEWFTPYLKPYVHYVPVSEDLADLHETMLWVKNHPKEIQAIAENGRHFHHKHLTFYKHEEHIYEFIYRLSEYMHFRVLQRERAQPS